MRRAAAAGAPRRVGRRSIVLLPPLLLLLLLAPVQEVGAFTVDVVAGSSECFTAVASSGEEVFGNYEILTEGSYAPVEVTVRCGGHGSIDRSMDV